MSTRTAFTVVGTVVGAYFGNAALGATIGSMVGGYVDPVKVKGPRLTDAQQQTSQDGVPIPLTFGVVRIQGNIIASGKLVEHKSKDGGKGSGTQTTSYTYTRTYAIGICEGPIAGVRRIWKNGKLVFDARPLTGSETIQQAHDRIMLNQFLNDHSLYFGTEDQVPDGELQSALDPDTVPAFRGLAYMVGADEDVTATAGAIPTYEFEIVTKGSIFALDDYVPVTYPEIMPFGLGPEVRGDPRFVNGTYKYAPFYFGETPNFIYNSLFDAVKAAAIHFGHRPYDAIPVSLGWGYGGSSVPLGWDSSNSLWPWQNFGDRLDQHNAVGTVVIPREQFTGAKEAQAIGSGGSYWPCAMFDEGIWAARFTNDVPPNPPGPGHSLSSGVMVYTEDPSIIDDADSVESCDPESAGGMYHAGDYLIYVQPIPDCNQFIDPDWLPVPGTVGVYVDRYGQYHTVNDCTVVEGDFRQLSVLVMTENGQAYTQAPYGPVLVTGSVDDTEAFWTDAYDFAVTEGKVPSGWIYGADYPKPVTQACLCSNGSAVFEGDVSLAEIVSALCRRATLLPEEIDVSELTERVIGYTLAAQTNAADAINTLAPAFFFDGAEWDAKTRFIKRGHDHVEVLTFDDSVETDDPRIKETRAQDLELPATIVLSYFDPAADFAVTTQRATRRSVTVNATGSDSLQLPVAMTSNQAAQVADVLMKDKWASLSGVLEQTIADEFSYLTPTDVVQIQSDGAIFRARLGQMTSQEGTLQYEATQDVQSAYTSNVEGLAPPVPDVGIDGPPSPTLAVYANLPALRDQDDQPGIYVAASGVFSPWPGVQFEVSRDAGATWSVIRNATQPSVIGQIVTTLPDWNSDIPAKAQSVEVTLTSGELSSITLAQLFQDLNGAVISDELIQFQTATLLGPGHYRLDVLVRGRKNTSYAAHSVGENFALLDSLYFLPLQRSDIGQTLMFRATTLGTANVDGIVATVTYNPPRSVQEWPVTRLRAARSGTDILFNWTPRGRLGTSAAPYQSSFFTGYSVTFTSGGVSRTYALTSNAFTYTAAMQTADFGAPVASGLAYTVAATNSITGAGTPRAGTI